MLVHLACRIFEVRVTDNVIAVKDAARLMTGDGHGHPLGHSGPHHVVHRGAAQVVKEFARKAGVPYGTCPGAPEPCHESAGVVEHVWAIQTSLLPSCLHKLPQLSLKKDLPTLTSFGHAGINADNARLPVYLPPRERESFFCAPAREVREGGHGL